jgi:hypothetical protein
MAKREQVQAPDDPTNIERELQDEQVSGNTGTAGKPPRKPRTVKAKPSSVPISDELAAELAATKERVTDTLSPETVDRIFQAQAAVLLKPLHGKVHEMVTDHVTRRLRG